MKSEQRQAGSRPPRPPPSVSCFRPGVQGWGQGSRLSVLAGPARSPALLIQGQPSRPPLGARPLCAGPGKHVRKPGPDRWPQLVPAPGTSGSDVTFLALVQPSSWTPAGASTRAAPRLQPLPKPPAGGMDAPRHGLRGPEAGAPPHPCPWGLCEAGESDAFPWVQPTPSVCSGHGGCPPRPRAVCSGGWQPP